MNPIDLYIEKLSPPEQRALETLRKEIHEILPDATECISYGMPAFRVSGTCVAGFAAFRHHLSFFPFSGSIIAQFAPELQGYTYTKSGIHFSPEKPLSRDLIERIITARIQLL